jgi:hypothetical protein
MDVERTMEFILEQQAKNQAMLAEMITEQNQRGAIIDRQLDRLDRFVTRLARLGVKSRTRVNRRLDEHDQWFAQQKLLMQEMGEKLNALIDVVDRSPRNPAA